MTILEKITELFNQRRRNGHTEATIRGAISMGNSTIVAANLSISDLIKRRILELDRNCEVRVISVNQLDVFRGSMPGPILLDHSIFDAMRRDTNYDMETRGKEWNRLLQESRGKIEGYKDEIKEHKEKIRDLEFQLTTTLLLSKGTEIKQRRRKK